MKQDVQASVHSQTAKWWKFSYEELCQELATDARKGLSRVEVQKRLAKYGPNQLPEAKEVSPVMLFIEQFKNFIILGASWGGFDCRRVGRMD
ncbi:MAG: cation-transporting P-type ATPase [Candidatus Omnitrophica bacterium]|nr:cation-transporting P-type ATPase [Candidatus Omnitrophota bacterium]